VLRRLLAVAVHDGLLDAALQLLGLGLEHGGLVGHADALEVQVGIEALRVAVLPGKAEEEGVPVTLPADVVADEVHVIEREEHEVVAFAVLSHGAGGGGARLLV
jgi:hypothetical protein